MGGQNRSCQSSWFTKPPPDGFPWLHYRPEDDSVACYICSNEFKKGNLKTVKKIEPSFISMGFQNWKKAIETFKMHQSSPCHTAAEGHTIRHSKDIVELTNKNISYLCREERIYQGHGNNKISFQVGYTIPRQYRF